MAKGRLHFRLENWEYRFYYVVYFEEKTYSAAEDIGVVRAA